MPEPVPLIVELPADDDRAGQMLALHEQFPERYPVLLESTAVGLPLGRFSLLLASPGRCLRLERDGTLRGAGEGAGFCNRLDGWWLRERGAAPPDPWPFAGGWFLFLGYELAGEVEPSLRLPPSPTPLVALAWRMQAALILDHETGRCILISEPAAAASLGSMQSDLEDAAGAASPAPVPLATGLSEEEPGRYLRACRAALAHIAAGDIYQANLARSWRARAAGGAGLRPAAARAGRGAGGALVGGCWRAVRRAGAAARAVPPPGPSAPARAG